ncbi:MAG: patatin family protein [Firmicutes bacterium]|nr:patatin family protein [Bacillota bacterium]
MKTGLVLEGGAMREMFTAGVLDVLMENKIEVDGLIGVSAGATFGCNYKSGQIGRTIRYNTRFCNDPRYCSFRSLLTTGDIYGAKFCYDTLPNKLDKFDYASFYRSPMEFYMVCTDVNTGRAVYHLCKGSGKTDLRWMRASASMPIVSRPVKIGNMLLLDGGLSDSIPLKHFESLGYNRNIVVLTQPLGYKKTQNRFLPLAKILMRKYPRTIKALATRHKRYNICTAELRKRELNGEILVIRPPKALEVGAVEHDSKKLLKVYKTGRKIAAMRLDEIKEFLSCRE